MHGPYGHTDRTQKKDDLRAWIGYAKPAARIMVQAGKEIHLGHFGSRRDAGWATRIVNALAQERAAPHLIDEIVRRIEISRRKRMARRQ